MRLPTTLTEVVTTLGGLEFRGEVLNLPAEGKDHDAFLVDDGFVGIADGSTPLVSDEAIDARRYARNALERLCQHHALGSVEMFRHALSVGDRPRTPISQVASCTVATLTATDYELTVSVLGDCIGLIRTEGGNTTVVCDRRLDRFDTPVAEQIAGAITQGMSIDEARNAANDRLIMNRNRANSIGSYWLFADDPAAADQIETASVDPSHAVEVFLCSDGFSRLIEPFHIARDAVDLLALAERGGLAELGRKLRLREEAPNSLVDHPRLDLSDDATAILLSRS